MTVNLDHLPRYFIWRRLHSLTGLWLVLFLIEHLVTNSQAALLLGESGQGFVRLVNALHNLPYLTAIEVGLLGIPILIHAFWGVQYALTAKPNSWKTDGSKPSLKYGRNRAYTWQRLTAWLLFILLPVHIVEFRFLDYPTSVNIDTEHPAYFVQVTMDQGLYTVAQRLGVTLYDPGALDALRLELEETRGQAALREAALEEPRDSGSFNAKDEALLHMAQTAQQRLRFLEEVTSIAIKKGDVVAAAPTFGAASLLSVRNTFKSPLWVGVYTLFVLSAVFHAFNGLWTSMLTWGWVIKTTAQTSARRGAIGLMAIIAFLGLAAVWGSYFLNLKR